MEKFDDRYFCPVCGNELFYSEESLAIYVRCDKCGSKIYTSDGSFEYSDDYGKNEDDYNQQDYFNLYDR